MDAATLESLPRKDLQALAKTHGIRANAKSADIIAELLGHIAKTNENAPIESAQLDTKPSPSSPAPRVALANVQTAVPATDGSAPVAKEDNLNPSEAVQVVSAAVSDNGISFADWNVDADLAEAELEAEAEETEADAGAEAAAPQRTHLKFHYDQRWEKMTKIEPVMAAPAPTQAEPSHDDDDTDSCEVEIQRERMPLAPEQSGMLPKGAISCEVRSKTFE